MFTWLHTHTYICYRTWQLVRGRHMLLCSGPQLSDKCTVICDTGHVTATVKISGYAQIVLAFKVRVITYLRTYLLTPRSRVLLEKLTGLQLVKKFPAFYGTRRYITAFTSARHLSLSWASSIQSIPPYPTSWRSILILSSHYAWVSSVVSFPQVSPPTPGTHLSSPPSELHAPPI
jgi:hypothetical protein